MRLGDRASGMIQSPIFTEVRVKSIRAASNVIFILKVQEISLSVLSPVAQGIVGPRGPQI